MRLLTVWLCLVLPTATNAEVTRVRLQLPPGVEYQGLTEANDRIEIKLSLSAFQAQVQADPRATIGLKDNSCVIFIPITPGELPAVSRVPVGAGPVVLTLFEEQRPTGNSGSGAHSLIERNVGPPPRPGAGDNGSASSLSTDASGGTSTTAAATPEKSAANKMEDLLGKALGPLGDGVKFDPVAMADYAIPASAAAAVIGSSSSLVRPATPREVVTGLLTDFDKDGRLQTGFSIAVTPYTLLRKMPLTAMEYQQEPTKRFLANLQFSLAAKIDDSIVTDGNKAARFGAGLTMILYDKGDLRLDNAFLTRIADTLARKFTADEANRSLEEIAFTSQEKLNDAGKQWDKEKAKRWNAASAGLGVAPAFLSFTGKLSGAKSDGVMTWLHFAIPGPGSLGASTQIILGGNARFRQRVLVDSVWMKSDVVDVGAQLRFGGEGGNFFAEGQYRHRSDSADKEKFVYELGYERRIADGVWLNLSWTNEDSIQGGKLVRAGVRYGFGQKAVLSPAKN